MTTDETLPPLLVAVLVVVAPVAVLNTLCGCNETSLSGSIYFVCWQNFLDVWGPNDYVLSQQEQLCYCYLEQMLLTFEQELSLVASHLQLFPRYFFTAFSFGLSCTI